MKNCNPLFIIFFLINIVFQNIFAQTVTFSGNGNFSEGTNWESGSKPASNGADIILADGATMVLDESYTCASLTVGIGASFGCNTGIVLTVTDGIYDGTGKKVISISSALQISSSIVLPQPYGIVTNATTGRIWMDRNLGASRVATSVNDSEAYGDLYQWGRLTDGHEKRTSGTTTTLSPDDDPEHGNFIIAIAFPSDWRDPQNDNLWQGLNGTNNPCPDGYRIPTEIEWTEEFNTWGAKSASEGFNALKLVLAGSRLGGGTISQVGGYGQYWSSTTNSYYAVQMELTSANARMSTSNRAYGFSVRCIKDDTPEEPTYEEVTSSTGRIWLDRNLGASRVATSSTDADAYGDLYQWGRLTDGHEKRTSGATTTLSIDDEPGHENFISGTLLDWRDPQNDNLWQGASGTNNPCPNGFRIPTEAEWNEERNSWSQNNSNGAFNSSLKLSLAGIRSYLGSIGNININGNYWSSTINGTQSRALILNTSNAYVGNGYRSSGSSVRCIQDDTIPEEEFTYEEVASPTGRIWLDRNLGATQAATSSTDADAYGDLYQWGRLTDGHEKRTSVTTTNISSGDDPEHGDFIINTTAPSDWRSPKNDNLWQGVDGINNPCPEGFRLPTGAEFNNEHSSWESDFLAGAYASPLKFTATGERKTNGNLDGADGYGFYWTSTLTGDYAMGVSISSVTYMSNYLYRGQGGAVRCIKEAVYEYNEVTSSTGRIWLDRNLGALRVASSKDDPAAYGDLYQWGRLTDGHEKRTSETTASISSADDPEHSDFIINTTAPSDWRIPKNDNLWQGVDGINNPCPEGFRLPTAVELDNEYSSWASGFLDDAYASPLKFTATGERETNGNLSGVGGHGFYWGSTISSDYSFGIWFSDGTYMSNYFYRAQGAAVRCIKDEPVE